MHLTGSSQDPSDPKDTGAGVQRTAAKESSKVNPVPMATIQDDDERLLARIGYKQVRWTPLCGIYPSPLPLSAVLFINRTIYVGTKTRVFQMVYRFVRHLHPWSFGLGPGDIWPSTSRRRSCYRSMVLVHRVIYGDVYC